MPKAIQIKELLQKLSYEEQREVILTRLEFVVQQCIVEMEAGIFVVHPDSEGFEPEVPIGTRTLLDEAVKLSDPKGVLKAGLVEFIRDLPLIQRGSVGPQINVYLKENLDRQLFDQVYEAAGLKIQGLSFDRNFPTKYLGN